MDQVVEDKETEDQVVVDQEVEDQEMVDQALHMKQRNQEQD